MESDFRTLGVPENLCRGLEARGIRRPTAIQTAAFAPIREGRDLLSVAQTGSGKTLAYLVPLLMGLDLEKKSPQVLILTPTHELAVQVERVARGLDEAAGLGFGTALLIGGASRERQLLKLREKPRVLVGNPGRVLELYRLHKLKMSDVHAIVLDEADRLLTLCALDVAAVIKTTLRDRQLLAFSASLGPKDREALRALMKPEATEVSAQAHPLPETIRHGYLVTPLREKTQTLRKLLAAEKPERALVFINNPENIRVLVDKLCYHGFRAAGLYGHEKKESRRIALADFREGRAGILVATDLAARGLDFPGLSHVIQLDAPEDPVQYQHRVGRCGRQGAAGTAVLLLTPGQVKWTGTYEKAFGIRLTEWELSYGKLQQKTDRLTEQKQKEEKEHE